MNEAYIARWHNCGNGNDDPGEVIGVYTSQERAQTALDTARDSAPVNRDTRHRTYEIDGPFTLEQPQKAQEDGPLINTDSLCEEIRKLRFLAQDCTAPCRTIGIVQGKLDCAIAILRNLHGALELYRPDIDEPKTTN